VKDEDAKVQYFGEKKAATIQLRLFRWVLG
jgi:hypothetical protein